MFLSPPGTMYEFPSAHVHTPSERDVPSSVTMLLIPDGNDGGLTPIGLNGGFGGLGGGGGDGGRIAHGHNWRNGSVIPSSAGLKLQYTSCVSLYIVG